MDRQIVYIGATPLDVDILNQSKNTMIGLGMAMQAILGTGTWVDALACTPQTVPNLTVQVGPGSIYSLQNVDSTAYGSLAADTTHQIIKQGIVLSTTTLSCPAPSTTGFSTNYLVEVNYQDVDGGSTTLNYYNSSNPGTAWSGPNNTGVSQNTVRQGVCLVQVKAGVAATTGTQTTPSPDAGFTGLYVVTVANGQTTITSASISQVSGAPFINPKLTGLSSLALNGHGQCRLTKSSSNLLLSPYNGNRLIINGTVQTIPSAGVSLTPSGLSANTAYYIYALMTSGTMTLEASATAYATDATTGVTVKSGDSTRTLVGMARTTAGIAFADSPTQRFVVSYFNRRKISLVGSVISSVSTSSTSGTLVELTTTARIEGLCWIDESISGSMTGYVGTTVAGSAQSALGLNSSTQITTASITSTTGSGFYGNIASSGETPPASEGYFNLTALGGAVTGGGAAGFTLQLYGNIRG